MADESDSLITQLLTFLPRLVKLADYAVGSQDGEDLASDVVATALHQIREGRFRGESDVKTWAYGIFKWKVHEYRERQNQRPVLLPEHLDERGNAIERADPITLRIEETQTVRLAVEEALQSLSASQRLIVVFKQRGLSAEKIASLLGKSIDAVDREYSKAKRSLRASLLNQDQKRNF